MPRIRLHRQFERAFKRLPDDIQERATKSLERFIANPRHPGLNFEALRGHPGLFSIRVNQGWRILLRRDQDGEGEIYVVADIGPHDVYRRI